MISLAHGEKIRRTLAMRTDANDSIERTDLEVAVTETQITSKGSGQERGKSQGCSCSSAVPPTKKRCIAPWSEAIPVCDLRCPGGTALRTVPRPPEETATGEVRLNFLSVPITTCLISERFRNFPLEHKTPTGHGRHGAENPGSQSREGRGLWLQNVQSTQYEEFKQPS